MLDYYRFKTVSDLFMKGKTEEARLELAELQRRYVALCDENTTFKMQIQEYEDILYLARNLILENGFYWLITGSVKQGPFCPHCYNSEGLLMRLMGAPEERCCPTCRQDFELPAAQQHSSPLAAAADGTVALAGTPVLESLRRKATVIPFRTL
ncbi:hypothetical protein LJC59_07870 [Desulfovibrio sp. OttesenSCG-928-A18]|nr:hypothetical protein [Desulfovibrio sp. OttesenSCG-928-A18]